MIDDRSATSSRPTALTSGSDELLTSRTVGAQPADPSAQLPGSAGIIAAVVFKKKPADPLPVWRQRFDESRSTVLAHVDRADIREGLDRVEHDLLTAETDRRRISEALAAMDPDRTLAELKAALREQGLAPDDHHVRRLRARHEAVSDLRNRADELGRAIETTLADVELLAVRSVGAGLGTASAVPFGHELERLHEGLTALESARDEVARIEREAGLR
jgi:hypothetical protein